MKKEKSAKRNAYFLRKDNWEEEAHTHMCGGVEKSNKKIIIKFFP